MTKEINFPGLESLLSEEEVEVIRTESVMEVSVQDAIEKGIPYIVALNQVYQRRLYQRIMERHIRRSDEYDGRGRE